MFREDTFGRDAFEDPYDLTYAVLWVEAHQKMHIVLVVPKLFDGQIVPLFNALHGDTDGGDYFRAQKCPAVF